MKKKSVNPAMAMMAARAMRTPAVARPQINPMAAAAAPAPVMPGMKKGGAMNLFKGKETYAEELKEAKAIKSGKITPEQYAKGEESEKKMKKGGKCYSAGGRMASKGEHSVQTKSKRGAMSVKMASGGYTKSADGIAKRGKTKGKMC